MNNNLKKNIIRVTIAVILVLLWLFLGTNAYEKEEVYENEVSHECFGMP